MLTVTVKVWIQPLFLLSVLLASLAMLTNAARQELPLTLRENGPAAVSTISLQGRQQGRPPKAAICFFGLTRSLEYVKDTIRSNIFDILIRNNWQYDVYLHTYNQTHLHNPRSREENIPLDVDAWKLLQPKNYIVEDPAPLHQNFTAELESYLKHGDAFKERKGHNTLRNLLLQYHSLQQVTSLWQESDYDVVMYLRPDMWYFNALNMTHFSASQYQPDHIYVPAFAWWLDLGINDRVAFGHPKVMKVYGNRGQHAKAYAQEYPMHAEKYVKYSLVSNGINITKTDLLAARMRSTGVLWGIPEIINGTWDFPFALDAKNHYFVFKTPLLGTWDAIRCNGSTVNGSRC